MNEVQRHRIQELILEFDAPLWGVSEDFKNKLNHLFRYALKDAMSRLFSQLSEPDRLDQIRKLEIDLGDLDPALPEEELGAIILRALEQQIRARLGELGKGQIQREGIRSYTGIDLLEFYLRTGGMPWWKLDSDKRDPDSLLMEYARDDPAGLSALFQRLGHLEQVRTRLVRRVKEESLLAFHEALVPGYHERAQGYMKVFQQLHLHSPLFQISHSDFRLFQWEFLFEFSARESNREFNPAGFLKFFFRKLAKRSGHSYQQLLRVAGQGLAREHIGTSAVYELPDTIGKLIEETRRGADFPSVVLREQEEVHLAFWEEAEDGDAFERLLFEQHAGARKMLLDFQQDLIHLRHVAGLFQEFEPSFFLVMSRRFILEYLFLEQGARFNFQAFLRSFMWKLAEAMHLPLQTLSSEMGTALQLIKGKAEFRSPLADFTALIPGLPVPDLALSGPENELPGPDAPPSVGELEVLLRKPVSRDPDFKQRLFQWGQSSRFRQELAGDSGPLFARVAGILRPGLKSFFAALVTDVALLLAPSGADAEGRKSLSRTVRGFLLDLIFRTSASPRGQLVVSRELFGKLASREGKALFAWVSDLHKEALKSVEQLQLKKVLPVLIEQVSKGLPEPAEPADPAEPAGAAGVSGRSEWSDENGGGERRTRRYRSLSGREQHWEILLNEQEWEAVQALEKDLFWLHREFVLFPVSETVVYHLFRGFLREYIEQEKGETFQLNVLFRGLIWKFSAHFGMDQEGLRLSLVKAVEMGSTRIMFESELPDLVAGVPAFTGSPGRHQVPMALSGMEGELGAEADAAIQAAEPPDIALFRKLVLAGKLDPALAALLRRRIYQWAASPAFIQSLTTLAPKERHQLYGFLSPDVLTGLRGLEHDLLFLLAGAWGPGTASRAEVLDAFLTVLLRRGMGLKKVSGILDAVLKLLRRRSGIGEADYWKVLSGRVEIEKSRLLFAQAIRSRVRALEVKAARALEVRAVRAGATVSPDTESDRKQLLVRYLLAGKSSQGIRLEQIREILTALKGDELDKLRLELAGNGARREVAMRMLGLLSPSSLVSMLERGLSDSSPLLSKSFSIAGEIAASLPDGVRVMETFSIDLVKEILLEPKQSLPYPAILKQILNRLASRSGLGGKAFRERLWKRLGRESLDPAEEKATLSDKPAGADEAETGFNADLDASGFGVSGLEASDFGVSDLEASDFGVSGLGASVSELEDGMNQIGEEALLRPDSPKPAESVVRISQQSRNQELFWQERLSQDEWEALSALEKDLYLLQRQAAVLPASEEEVYRLFRTFLKEYVREEMGERLYLYPFFRGLFWKFGEHFELEPSALAAGFESAAGQMEPGFRFASPILELLGWLSDSGGGAVGLSRGAESASGQDLWDGEAGLDTRFDAGLDFGFGMDAVPGFDVAEWPFLNLNVPTQPGFSLVADAGELFEEEPGESAVEGLSSAPAPALLGLLLELAEGRAAFRNYFRNRLQEWGQSPAFLRRLSVLVPAERYRIYRVLAGRAAAPVLHAEQELLLLLRRFHTLPPDIPEATVSFAALSVLFAADFRTSDGPAILMSMLRLLKAELGVEGTEVLAVLVEQIDSDSDAPKPDAILLRQLRVLISGALVQGVGAATEESESAIQESGERIERSEKAILESGSETEESGTTTQEFGGETPASGVGLEESEKETFESGPGTLESVAGTQEPGPGTSESVAGTQEPGSGTLESVAGTQEPGPGTLESVAGRQEPGPGTSESVAGTQEPGPGTLESVAGTKKPGTIETDSKVEKQESGTARPEGKGFSIADQDWEQQILAYILDGKFTPGMEVADMRHSLMRMLRMRQDVLSAAVNRTDQDQLGQVSERIAYLYRPEELTRLLEMVLPFEKGLVGYLFGAAEVAAEGVVAAGKKVQVFKENLVQLALLEESPIHGMRDVLDALFARLTAIPGLDWQAFTERFRKQVRGLLGGSRVAGQLGSGMGSEEWLSDPEERLSDSQDGGVLPLDGASDLQGGRAVPLVELLDSQDGGVLPLDGASDLQGGRAVPLDELSDSQDGGVLPLDGVSDLQGGRAVPLDELLDSQDGRVLPLDGVSDLQGGRAVPLDELSDSQDGGVLPLDGASDLQGGRASPPDESFDSPDELAIPQGLLAASAEARVQALLTFLQIPSGASELLDEVREIVLSWRQHPAFVQRLSMMEVQDRVRVYQLLAGKAGSLGGDIEYDVLFLLSHFGDAVGKEVDSVHEPLDLQVLAQVVVRAVFESLFAVSPDAAPSASILPMVLRRLKTGLADRAGLVLKRLALLAELHRTHLRNGEELLVQLQGFVEGEAGSGSVSGPSSDEETDSIGQVENQLEALQTNPNALTWEVLAPLLKLAPQDLGLATILRQRIRQRAENQDFVRVLSSLADKERYQLYRLLAGNALALIRSIEHDLLFLARQFSNPPADEMASAVRFAVLTTVLPGNKAGSGAASLLSAVLQALRLELGEESRTAVSKMIGLATREKGKLLLADNLLTRLEGLQDSLEVRETLPPEADSDTLKTAVLDYLVEGHLAPGTEPAAMRTVLEKVIAEGEDVLFRQLKGGGHARQVAERIAFLYSPEALLGMLERVLPADRKLIDKLFREAKLIFAQTFGAKDHDQAFREEAVRMALLENRRYNSSQVFFEGFLKRSASRMGMSWNAFLEGVRKTADTGTVPLLRGLSARFGNRSAKSHPFFRDLGLLLQWAGEELDAGITPAQASQWAESGKGEEPEADFGNVAMKTFRTVAGEQGIELKTYLKQMLSVLRAGGDLYAWPGTLSTISKRLVRELELRKAPPPEPPSIPVTPSTRKPWDMLTPGDFFLAEYQVPAAGVVLLEPYIPRYFEVLGLTQNKAFLDDAARERAVYLLRYLADGVTDPPDESLVLNKVLCGMEPLTVLNMQSFTPTDQERDMTESLLKAALAHWSSFGQGDPRDLQGSFLRRSGTLGKTKKSWKIQLDRAPYDVMLKTLPWSFNPVTFSWLEKFIAVFWDTSI